MKLLFHKLCLPLLAALLVISAAFVAQAQDARIQTASLDHLATKASQTVDVNIDERLMRLASKLLSAKDAEEKEIKELVAGIKGIYVRSFEFEADGQYTPTSRVRLVCRSDRQEPLGRVLSVQTTLQCQFPPGEQEGALKNDLP